MYKRQTYQCVYHEHMAKMIADRPWLWATHVWNMFDFAADGRDEEMCIRDRSSIFFLQPNISNAPERNPASGQLLCSRLPSAL